MNFYSLEAASVQSYHIRKSTLPAEGEYLGSAADMITRVRDKWHEGCYRKKLQKLHFALLSEGRSVRGCT